VIWPLHHLAELARVAAADRRFAAPGEADELERDQLARRALEIAVGELGRGESNGNNRGPDVARYLAPATPPANWCAGFAGYCYQRAAGELAIALPFSRSLGAKRIGRNVAAAGRQLTSWRDAQPGDLLVWHRGASGSWLGHVGLLERIAGDVAHTIEGNSGPRVMRRAHYPDRERLAFAASIRLT
jgi:hypothetical protein